MLRLSKHERSGLYAWQSTWIRASACIYRLPDNILAASKVYKCQAITNPLTISKLQPNRIIDTVINVN